MLDYEKAERLLEEGNSPSATGNWPGFEEEVTPGALAVLGFQLNETVCDMMPDEVQKGNERKRK